MIDNNESTKMKKKPGVAPNVNSQRQKCLAILKKMEGMPRKDIIAAFVAAGVKKPTANTYYHDLSS